MMCGLFHYGIRCTDATETQNFYTRLLDMRVDHRRAPMAVKGFWLRTANPDSPASIHVFTEEYARVGDAIPQGSGGVHHIALYCTGYHATRKKLAELGLSWCGVAAPGMTQWVIFVYDPNGIMLELAFEAAIEGGPVPDIPEANRYVPGDPWPPFRPQEYAVFAE